MKLSPLQWLVAIIGFGIIALYVSSQIETKHADAVAAAAQLQTDAAKASWNAAFARLDTPAAFEAKCGKSTWHHTIDGNPTLIYDEPIVEEPRGSETLTVTFDLKSKFVGFADSIHDHRYLESPQTALKSIGCVLP